MALFMFVQISIGRWFASLEPRPSLALAAIIVAGLLWMTTILVVSAPYSRYEAKGYSDIPLKFKKSPPAFMNLSVREQVTVPGKPSKTETKMVRVVVHRKPAGLGFKIYAFNLAAERSRAVTSFLIIIAASAFGYLVSMILRHPNIILPVAAFAPFIDVWTVLVGPTSKAIENAPHVVHTISAAIPAPGGASTGFQPMSFIGPADFIFIAMFFAAIYRLKMNPVGTFWVLFPILTLSMGAVLAGLFPPGLPALVPIGLAVLVANRRHFKLKRDEYVALGIVAALLAASIIVFTIVSATKAR